MTKLVKNWRSIRSPQSTADKYSPNHRIKIKEWNGEPFINFETLDRRPIAKRLYKKLVKLAMSDDFEDVQLAIGHYLDWSNMPL